MKSKLTAGILALLLGGIGAHKFYLGKGLQGFIYLLFCLTGIPAIVGFIEGVYYLVMDDHEFQRKFGAYQAGALPPAQSGGGSQNAQNVTINMPSNADGRSGGVSDELKKLADLRAAGVLSEAEFEEQKRRLLE